MTAQGSPVGVLVLVSVALAICAAFVAWRVTTPGECARLTSAPSAWTTTGVLPTAEVGCPVHTGDEATGVIASSVDSVRYAVVRDGEDLVVDVPLGPADIAPRLAPGWSTLLFVGSLVGVGAYAFVRRPRDRAAQALLLMGTGLATSTIVYLLELPLHGGFSPWPRNLFLGAVVGCYLLGWGGVLAFALVFPWRTPWSRFAAPAAVAPALLATAVAVIGSFAGPFVAASAAIDAEAALTLVVFGVAIVVFALRVRGGAPDQDAARQVRWVGLTGAAALMLAAALWLVPQLVIGRSLLPGTWIGLPGLIAVAGLLVALLRQRLFGLDVVLLRTLVASGLALGIVTVYTGITALLGASASAVVPVQVALVAAAGVALTLDPMRRGLTRLGRRALYGDRDDPYRALSRLGERIADATRRDVLPLVADEIAQALRSPWVGIAAVGRPLVVAGPSTSPPSDDGVEALPLVHHSERLGTLRIARRRPDEPFDPAERRLLAGLAGRVAAAVAEERLDAAVRASRERLVLAREEERRALRRMLHDEVTPTIAGIALRAATAQALVTAPGREGELDRTLAGIAVSATQAAAEVRELSYGLRPPALDERGLVLALREHADELAVKVDVVSDLGPEVLPAAAEVAAYRIAVGALANVVAHADATRAQVAIERLPDALRVTVQDDGTGMAPGTRAGVGLTSMHERAGELGGELVVSQVPGGGTRLVAVLPLVAVGAST